MCRWHFAFFAYKMNKCSRYKPIKGTNNNKLLYVMHKIRLFQFEVPINCCCQGFFIRIPPIKSIIDSCSGYEVGLKVKITETKRGAIAPCIESEKPLEINYGLTCTCIECDECIFIYWKRVMATRHRSAINIHTRTYIKECALFGQCVHSFVSDYSVHEKFHIFRNKNHNLIYF